MKYKTQILSLLLLVVSLTAFSQKATVDDRDASFLKGVAFIFDFGMGTYNVPTSSFSSTAISQFNTDRGLNFNLTAGARIDISRHLFLQPALAYSQKQYDFSFKTQADGVKSTLFPDIALYCFDIPVQFGYITDFENVNLWFMAGPMLSILMSEDISYHRVGGIDNVDSEAVTEEAFERDILSLAAKVSMGMEYQRLRLSASYIYEWESKTDYFGNAQSLIATVGVVID